MIHLATAILAMHESPEADALQRRLQDAHYVCVFASSVEEALAAAKHSRPDVFIVGPGLADADVVTAVRAIRADGRFGDLPVFALTIRPLSEVGASLLEAGADDAAEWPESPQVVALRVRPLVRAATMLTEFMLRAEIAGAFGMSVDTNLILDEESAPNVIILGTQLIVEVIEQALGVDGGASGLERATDLFEAQRLMEVNRYDAAVLAPVADIDPFIDLCVQIRRNPRLFNLPVVMMIEELADADPVAIHLAGASNVLPASTPAATLTFVLTALVRRQRLRWAIRQALNRTLGLTTSDGVVHQVYSNAFLEAYLERRLGTVEARDREFAVIGFDFAGVEAIRKEFGPAAEASLAKQIGQWLTLLVRAEDLVAKITSSRFIVTLPDTPIEEANVVMHRIAGVISNTDFAVKDVYRVVKIWPMVNAAGLTASDTVHSLLQRAAARFETLDGAG